MIEEQNSFDRIIKSLNKIKKNKQALIRTADTLEGIATGIEIAYANQRNRNSDNKSTERN